MAASVLLYRVFGLLWIRVIVYQIVKNNSGRCVACTYLPGYLYKVCSPSYLAAVLHARPWESQK